MNIRRKCCYQGSKVSLLSDPLTELHSLSTSERKAHPFIHCVPDSIDSSVKRSTQSLLLGISHFPEVTDNKVNEIVCNYCMIW